MFHTFLDNNIHCLSIGLDFLISWCDLYRLGYVANHRSTICYSILILCCSCSFNSGCFRLWFMGTFEFSFITFNDLSRGLCLYRFTNHGVYCRSIFHIRSIYCRWSSDQWTEICCNRNEWKLKQAVAIPFDLFMLFFVCCEK